MYFFHCNPMNRRYCHVSDSRSFANHRSQVEIVGSSVSAALQPATAIPARAEERQEEVLRWESVKTNELLTKVEVTVDL